MFLSKFGKSILALCIHFINPNLLKGKSPEFMGYCYSKLKFFR